MFVQHDKLCFYSNTGARLHLQTSKLTIPPILQEGVQGREIWSVDLCRLDKSGRILCASSAEDNTIKIHEWREGKTGSLQTVFRYPEPDGTLQNVRWSLTNPEDTFDSALLLATAAEERLFALRVTFSKEEQTPDVVKIGEAPRCPDQVDDARTMSLDVLRLPGSTIHAVLAGSSDGSLKVSRPGVHWGLAT